MSESAVVLAGRDVADRLGDMRTAAISADDRILALTGCETLMRRLEQFQIELITGLDREGVFAERGYRSAAHAVADLLGWDTGQARRRLKLGAEITSRTTLDGQPLPARLPATAAAFAAGEISLRHAEVIAEALRTPAAARLDARVWAGAEAKLAEQAPH